MNAVSAERAAPAHGRPSAERRAPPRSNCEPLVATASMLSKPGDHAVGVPLVCVITRFGLRSPLDLLPAYLDHRKVVREAKGSATPGLLRATFLVSSPRDVFTLSIWSDMGSIPWFGTNVPGHVDVARRMFRRLRTGVDGGPELWSTKWMLASVSNNLSWDDFDLRSAVAMAMAQTAS
jgi:hypothetical protein